MENKREVFLVVLVQNGNTGNRLNTIASQTLFSQDAQCICKTTQPIPLFRLAKWNTVQNQPFSLTKMSHCKARKNMPTA